MTSKYEVYKNLQLRIITKNIGPGEKLIAKELMDHYQLGRTPLREIFHELKRDGLIEIIPKLGTLVTSPDISELKEIVQVRRRLEGLVGILAVEKITKEQLNKFRTLLREAQEVDPEDQDANETLTSYDVELHQVLYESTQNKVLAEIISQLQKRMSKFWHQVGFTFEEFTDEIEDFTNVLDACEKRNADKAAIALENHIDHFVKKVRDYML